MTAQSLSQPRRSRASCASRTSGEPLPFISSNFEANDRLTERDKVRMGECFRLGDIVKAKVLSLGDARSYYLSTAANELGVVYATSEDGE